MNAESLIAEKVYDHVHKRDDVTHELYYFVYVLPVLVLRFAFVVCRNLIRWYRKAMSSSKQKKVVSDLERKVKELQQTLKESKEKHDQVTSLHTHAARICTHTDKEHKHFNTNTIT